MENVIFFNGKKYTINKISLVGYILKPPHLDFLENIKKYFIFILK